MNKELNELKISFNNLVDSAVRLNELYEKKCKSELELREENNRLNNIINKALEKSKGLQYRFGYVLDDLIYLLMQGEDKECN